MILFPIGSFYFMHYVVFNQDQSTLGYSGIVAVFAANVVSISYAYMAYNEEDPDRKIENKSNKTD